MEKEFVPYEQALALKELGFDEECLMYWNYYGTTKIKQVQLLSSIDDWSQNYVEAPLWQQAFKWFREKYSYVVPIEEKWFSNTNTTKYQFRCPVTDELFKYDTYEEAELECLIKLIELCKQNLK
jgi:hypothetical protein